jgi:cytochrome c553
VFLALACSGGIANPSSPAMKSFALILVLAACGSKAAPTTAATTPADHGTAAVATLPDVAFDQLDHDQRIEFMKQKVMPAMQPVFQNHDAKKYADFTCKTCHGSQAAEGHFDMPSTETPKLNFKDMGKWKKEDLEWMSKEVKPAMAKLLARPEFTPENPKGFGCQDCHTTE